MRINWFDILPALLLFAPPGGFYNENAAPFFFESHGRFGMLNLCGGVKILTPDFRSSSILM